MAQTFHDLKFEERPWMGMRARVACPNGYGVSVVLNSTSYGHEEGLFEAAVLADNRVCYDSGITDDVLGWQTPADITDLLAKVEALPTRGGAR
jgi:hypothetical protein